MLFNNNKKTPVSPIPIEEHTQLHPPPFHPLPPPSSKIAYLSPTTTLQDRTAPPPPPTPSSPPLRVSLKTVRLSPSHHKKSQLSLATSPQPPTPLSKSTASMRGLRDSQRGNGATPVLLLETSVGDSSLPVRSIRSRLFPRVPRSLRANYFSPSDVRNELDGAAGSV